MASSTVRELVGTTDLSEIIASINQASDRELSAIKQISDYLYKSTKSTKTNTRGENNSPKRPLSVSISDDSISKPLSELSKNITKVTNQALKVKKGEQKGRNSPKSRLGDIAAQSAKIADKPTYNRQHVAIPHDKKPPANDPFVDFWKDEKGRLRKANGQYASKDEQAGFAKSKIAKNEATQEKNTSLLGRLVGYSKKAGIAGANLFSTANDAANSSTADMVGGAAGGTMYYVAKELFDVANDSVNAVKDTAAKVSDLNDARKKKKEEKLQKKQLKLAQIQENDKKKDPIAGSALAKDKANKRDQLEVLRDQTSEDKQFHNELLKTIDGIKSSVSAASANGSDNGIIDSVIGTLAGGAGAAGAGKWIKGKFKPSLTSVEELASSNVKPKASTFSKLYSSAKGKVPFLDRIGNMASKSGGALESLGKGFIKKIPLIGALVDGGMKANELKDRDDLSNSQKGAQVVAHTAGGWAGAVTGGAAGAAIGSVIPVVGTAIGGVVGSVLGGMGGSEIGDVIGKGISNYMGSDGSISKVMDNAAENTKNAIISGADALKESVNGLSKLFGGGALFDTNKKSSLPPSSANATYKQGDKIDQRLAKYKPKIAQEALKNGLPPALMEMLIRQESGGIANARSGVGAQGLTQLMPAAASEVGVTNRLDANQSIAGGSKYLGKLVAKYKKKGFKDDDAYKLALSGYNAGSGWTDAGIRSVSRSGKEMTADNILAAMRDPSLSIQSKGKTLHRSASSIKESDDYVKKIYSNFDAKRKQSKGIVATHAAKVAQIQPSAGVTLAQNGTIQKITPKNDAIQTNQSVRTIAAERTKQQKVISTDKPQTPKKLSPSLKPTNKTNPANQPTQIKSEFESDYMRRFTWDLN